MAAAISRRSTLRLLKHFQSSSPSSFVSQNRNRPSSFFESHPKHIINHSACTKPNSSQFMMRQHLFRFESPRFFCNNRRQDELELSALMNEIKDICEDAKKNLYHLKKSMALVCLFQLGVLAVSSFITGSGSGVEIRTHFEQLFSGLVVLLLAALHLRSFSFEINNELEKGFKELEMKREKCTPQDLLRMREVIKDLKESSEMVYTISVANRWLVYSYAVMLVMFLIWKSW